MQLNFLFFSLHRCQRKLQAKHLFFKIIFVECHFNVLCYFFIKYLKSVTLCFYLYFLYAEYQHR